MNEGEVVCVFVLVITFIALLFLFKIILSILSLFVITVVLWDVRTWILRKSG